jgi:hypothetical protein
MPVVSFTSPSFHGEVTKTSTAQDSSAVHITQHWISNAGTERLCRDLGLEPADRKVLLLAWKMRAQRMGYFSRLEWSQGKPGSINIGSRDLIGSQVLIWRLCEKVNVLKRIEC